MLASYDDILEEMTRLLRDSHSETLEHGEGPSSECPNSIDPSTDRCTCVARPLWHDENGAPRFAEHHPKHCSDIYADEVALLLISCQSCGHEFRVQMSRSMMDGVREYLGEGARGPVAAMVDEALAIAVELDGHGTWNTESLIVKRVTIAERITAIRDQMTALRKMRPKTLGKMIEDGSIHYGDPPNTDCCGAGPTMNCDDHAVLEFWRRGPAVGPLDEAIKSMDWRRIPALEGPLPRPSGDIDPATR